ncbi:FAD binding domain protein, partial [Plectosphaerella plurivora]
MRYSFRTALLLLVAPIVSADAQCKCAPGDACWPSDIEWAQLNTTVSGRLIKTVAPAASCYPQEPSYNAEQCALIREEWFKDAFHSGNPVSLHSPSATNNSCNPLYPNGTSVSGDVLARAKGCSLGLYPPYVVNATGVEHVQAAVKFARDRNLRLNIKNTGHSVRSAAYGSLSIWTHYIRKFETHEEWTPQCPANSSDCGKVVPQLAVTIGAGERDDELFQAAAAEGLAVVGGTNPDVGFMGWATGGGHGYMTSEYGQGADNILEALMVIPSGDVIIANAYLNEDVFWAIRGGGGGSYGVIVEATIAAYPMPQASYWMLTMSNKDRNCTSRWYKLMAEMHGFLPAMKEGGFQGYYAVRGPSSASSDDDLSFIGLWFVYDKPNGTAQALAAPLLKLVEAAGDVASFQSTFVDAPTWIEVYNSFPKDLGSPGGGGASTTSRLLSADALTNDTERLAHVLEVLGPRPGGPVGGVSNPSLSGTMTLGSVAVDNALNPVWRDAVVHLTTSVSWDDTLNYAAVEAAI